MNTELAEMFVENTGKHMLDSGGAYGRHWQRHKEAAGEMTAGEYCESRPEAWIDDVSDNYIGVTLDTYHLLKDKLSFSEEMNEAFYEWYGDSYAWTGAVEEWLEECFPEARGIIGGPVHSGNTYNDENCLSQTFQYVDFTVDGDSYVALQIHGGCDVRGGYTSVKIFELDSYDPYEFFCWTYCGIYGNPVDEDSSEGVSWYSDNGGCSFYESNGEYEDLSKYRFAQAEDLDMLLKANEGTLRLIGEGVFWHRDENYNYRAFFSDGETLFELFGSQY